MPLFHSARRATDPPVTLREYVDASTGASRETLVEIVRRLDGRMDDAQSAVAAALSAAEKAVAKAEAASEARFESVNEFRGQLNDQATHLMPRAEFEAQHRDVVRQLAELRDSLGSLRTAVAVGPTELKRLSAEQAHDTGRAAGQLDARSALMAVLIFLAGVGAVVSPHIH
jgi:hypothetical protein